MFDEHVRHPLPRADLSDDEKAERLVDAFRTLLPDGHHARRAPLPQRAARGRAGAPRSRSATRPSSRRRATTPEPGTGRVVTAVTPTRRAPLPEGDEKRVDGRGDVRPHRAALRPHEPRDLARAGPRAGADARSPRSRLAPGLAACSTSRAAPATCATTSRPSGYRAGRRRLLGRDARAAAHRRPRSCAPTCACSRSPTRRFDGVTCGFALRNFVALAPRSSPSARACCAPAVASPPLDAAEPDEPVVRAGQHGLVPPASCRASARLLVRRRRRLPVPPDVDRVPPAAPDARSNARGDAGFADATASTPSTGGAVQLLTGTRA